MDSKFTSPNQTENFVNSHLRTIVYFQSTARDKATVINGKNYSFKNWPVFVVKGTIQEDVVRVLALYHLTLFPGTIIPLCRNRPDGLYQCGHFHMAVNLWCFYDAIPPREDFCSG